MASKHETGFSGVDTARLASAYLLLAFSGRAQKQEGEAALQLAGPQPPPQAQSPAQIEAIGWLDIARRVWNRIGKDRIIAVAAGFTFYAVLALFPTITALVSIYGLFADTAAINAQMQALAGVLPDAAIGVVRDQVVRVSSQGSQTLGLAFAVSLAGSIWSANAGVKAMFDALNVAYEEDESRGFIKLNLLSLGFTLGLVFFAIIAVAATVGVPVALAYVNLHSDVLEAVIRWSRWPLLLVLVMLALAMLYRFGPARITPQWRWISVGSAFASVCWLAASSGFSWYAANFANYNATYGALGAIIAFMTWIWVSAIVVMTGAEINAQTEALSRSASPSAPPDPE